MISFPNAKINIGLYITGRRDDGYHNIESIFYPVPLSDALEMVVADTFRFTTSGLNIPGEDDANLCVKAWRIMHSRFEAVQPVHMHLRKMIPMGAGLGGGSADGAFAILMLNDMFQLGLKTPELEVLALELGSDCPFFIRNRPAFVHGRGELMESHALDLSGLFLVLVDPRLHVGTREAYSGVNPVPAPVSLRELSKEMLLNGQSLVRNQFEDSVVPLYPEIGNVIGSLKKGGALYASMTGSGSAVYGLFEKHPGELWPNAWYFEL
ncbi:MAG: 4-(cytidine 5'-diphospho)-2-C-methyl-D-erythritol kinase [Cryomorphaceae bacterium]|nr:MAG: 4-(cytidine 5'-diphospho)-2-C-methyl-D-erythritol kinase [Cryomorphaceae bacterium]